MQLPYLSVEQMREVDRLMMNEFDIGLLTMMERAGHNLADFLIDKFEAKEKKIVIVVGLGNNGGGGMVCARYLAKIGLSVSVITMEPEMSFKLVPKQQWIALEPFNSVNRVVEADNTDLAQELILGADLLVDAIIGYGMAGGLRSNYKTVVDLINKSKAEVVSLDIPSGLGEDGLNSHENTVRANATLTLALPKKVLLNRAEFTGELYLADIGVPVELYSRMGLQVDEMFENSSIVHI